MKVDVVVIGGGIIGASTAFYLAKKGFKTASDGCAAPLKAAPANADLIKTAMKRFRADYPVLADLQVKAAWDGFIDSTPDARPAISAVETLPGFHVAAGFSGRGFGLGPGAGQLAANLIVGDPPIVDPRPFRCARFVDGSKVRPSSWI